MLTRAAREQNRRHLRQYLLSEYSNLSLPWLCPALYTAHAPRRHASTPPSSPASTRIRPSKHSNTSKQPSTTRQLATAIDTFRPDLYHDAIPFDAQQLPSSSISKPHDSRPRQDPGSPYHFDPSNLIIVPQRAARAQLSFRELIKSAVPSDLGVLQQNLYACVQVGRLDRAAILVHRITDMFVPDAPSVVDAHQRYLSGCLEQLLRSPSQQGLTAMQKWLELDVRARGVPVGHGIIAIMLKATLATLVGSRLDRTIRRYVKVAQDAGSNTFENTLSSSIFAAHEVNKILRVLPQQFEPPSEELGEEEIREIDTARRAAYNQVTGSRLSEHLDPIAALKPVEQKGLGLEALKRSLGSLSLEYLDESKSVANEQSQTERQIRLEQDVADAAMERWRTEHETFEQSRSQGKLQQAPLGSQIHKWVEAMSARLVTELKAAEDPNTEHSTKEEYEIVAAAPFLRLMTPDRVSSIAVLQFFSTIMDPTLFGKGYFHGPRIVRACEKMGTMLFKEARIEKIQTHYIQSLSNLPSAERSKRLSKLLKGKKWSQKHVEAEYAKIAKGESVAGFEDWEQNHGTAIKVGAVLLGILLKVAKITTYAPNPTTGQNVWKTQPVATHMNEWRRGRKVGILRVPDELVQMVKKEPVASLVAKHLPMIVRPKPWSNLKDGGYLTTTVPVVRFSDFQMSQRAYMEIAHKRGDMDRVYAGLDVISKTPWRVNDELLRVMVEVWNSGERAGKIVPEQTTSEYPPRPESDDRDLINRWKHVLTKVKNEISSNHSQRCYQNFQLEVARAFSNTTFYCPQNIDYRGRAYPIPPYFNHTGADHVRALFNFAHGKELGTEGLFWLKVQLANVYGYDKASLSDRAAFVDANTKNICESAMDPLGARRWWLEAGDPWQTLAACMELKHALDLPDPTKHVSHLPIQQDGSCNGLQHYAALGGDEVGARQVNLSPGDKPADVYTAVAELVKAIVHDDAKAGDRRAKALDGHVTRKMVKQPVMTNVYGVTYHGATHQVAKQLRDILPESDRSLDPDTSIFKLSAYVSSCIFKALNEMFTGAQAIQTWLGECGARISSAVTPEQISRIQGRKRGLDDPEAEARKIYSKSNFSGSKKKVISPVEDASFKSTIVWTTPLGLPVVQPYRDYRRKTIRTHLQDIAIITPSGSDPVNKRRQLQGFPPNFIHSLDATHMMLSALKCDEIGLTFGSVHDSFWTHAADVPTLNRVLRDAFVSMHKEDIIRRLKEEFEARYKGCYVWTSTRMSSPLGKRLVEYFRTVKARRKAAMMKQTMSGGAEIDDLLEESKRAKLLHSEDPVKRQEGAQMVTASSIAEEAGAGDDQIYSTESWGAYINREMPDTTASERGEADEQLLEEPSAQDAEDAAFAPEEDLDLDDGETAAHMYDLDQADSFERDSKKQAQGTTRTDQAAAKAEKAAKNKAHVKKRERVFFWKVITFPEPPPKGSFDVRCLKESQYFFS